MLSPSFQTSLFSKKIKKMPLSPFSLRHKCSDLHLSRRQLNPYSELPSPHILEIKSPRSAALLRFPDETTSISQNKLLKCSLIQKDHKAISKLFSRRAAFSSKKEVFSKIDEIVGKLQPPNQLDFSAHMQEIKLLSSTQEQIVRKLVNDSEEPSRFLSVPQIPAFEEITKQFENRLATPENYRCLGGDFLENFDFQLNVSSPLRKSFREFDKENRSRSVRKCEEASGESTPCTTPLLERKRLLSSSKVENMMLDLSPKQEPIIDFEALLRDLGEDQEITKWNFEEKEEWEAEARDLIG